jgi:hypothetical protein
VNVSTSLYDFDEYSGKQGKGSAKAMQPGCKHAPRRSLRSLVPGAFSVLQKMTTFAFLQKNI